MDARIRLPAIPLGQLQRDDDDVSARARIVHPSAAHRYVGCLEARPRSNTTGFDYIGSFAPLFVHQYSQAWFDFRDKRDKYADYFKNSILATEAHRRFCMDLSSQFSDYSEDLWGITASDSASGYVVWGGPPATGPIDGTVVPCAAGGSLPFLPLETMRVLRNIKDRYGRAPGAGTDSSTRSILSRIGTTLTSSASTPESPW